MKYVLEFGVRGGNSTNVVLSSAKLGKELFEKLIFVFDPDKEKLTFPRKDSFGKDFPVTCPSITWQSSTHFVALTVITLL